MKFLILVLVALLAITANATVTSDQQYLLNHMNDVTQKTGLGDLMQNHLAKSDTNTLVAKAVYDFSKKGGAIGDITLSTIIPAKAIVTRVKIDVLTAPTSAGSATVAVKLVNAGDLLPATAKASVTGILDGVPDGTAAHDIKLVSAASVKITVAVAALTAGKMNIFVEYYLSN